MKLESKEVKEIAEPVVEEIGTETRDSKGTFLSLQSVISFQILQSQKTCQKSGY